MHDFVLVVEVFGESTGWYIFDLAFEDLRDRVPHLLQDVKEEHQLVLSLFTVGHVFVKLVYSGLELLIFLENFAAFI